MQKVNQNRRRLNQALPQGFQPAAHTAINDLVANLDDQPAKDSRIDPELYRRGAWPDCSARPLVTTFRSSSVKGRH
jgi:hypothetical protein